jgi:hypothetical protein
MYLSNGTTGQKKTSLTFYSKAEQIFHKTLNLHDPILISSFKSIKNSNT